MEWGGKGVKMYTQYSTLPFPLPPFPSSPALFLSYLYDAYECRLDTERLEFEVKKLSSVSQGFLENFLCLFLAKCRKLLLQVETTFSFSGSLSLPTDTATGGSTTIPTTLPRISNECTELLVYLLIADQTNTSIHLSRQKQKQD